MTKMTEVAKSGNPNPLIPESTTLLGLGDKKEPHWQEALDSGILTSLPITFSHFAVSRHRTMTGGRCPT